MIFLKRCVLHAEKVCSDCGECDDRCELDPQKICDNCFRCLDEDAKPYAEIPISGVFFDDDFSADREGETAFDADDGYVMDTDESWRGGAMFRFKTLPFTFGNRVRRGHGKG